MISILSLILSLLAVPQLPDPASLMRLHTESAQRYRSLQYVSESTTEVQTGGIPGIKIANETTVSVVNPGKSRTEVKGPSTMTVVSDGDFIWIYSSILKQYTKTAAASGPAAMFASFGLGDLPDTSALMGSAKTVREDTVEVEGKARPAWVVELRFDSSNVPPVRNAQISEGLSTQWIDKELGIGLRSILTMKMETSAANTKVQVQMNQTSALKALKVDTPLDASLFTFTPPPDAKEVATFTSPVGAAPQRADLSGKNAPAFDVKTLEGTPYSLSSLKGKTVLLDFWASWCGPCRKAMPALESINRDYKDKGLVILGIDANEDRKTVEGFLKTTPASYPTVLSTGSDILANFQVTAYPTFVLIGPDGRIVAHEIGFNNEPTLRAMLAKVNIGGRPAAIQGLPAPPPSDTFRVGPGVTPPTVLSRVTPEYSDAARAARLQGTVVLEAVIQPDGTPRILRVVRGLGLGLDENAITAIEQWRFRPGIREGVPVAVTLNIEVNFNLADGR